MQHKCSTIQHNFCFFENIKWRCQLLGHQIERIFFQVSISTFFGRLKVIETGKSLIFGLTQSPEKVLSKNFRAKNLNPVLKLSLRQIFELS